MKKIYKVFLVSSALCFLLFNSASVYAHTMWLNVSNYSPEIYSSQYGARTKVYFGWGHRYPVDDFLSKEKLKDFSLIYPCGKKEKLNPNPGGFLATNITFSSEGTYIVTAVLKPGFYTMYVKRGEIHHKSSPKTGFEGVILSLYFEQYTKALINVGEGTDSFSQPIGHKLEIIPLKNPRELKVGDFLPVQVLFEGKPARFYKVYGTYAGFSTEDDFAYATTTNSKGKANIRIMHYGPWLIKTDIKLRAPEELKDKCNKLHYTATLSFEVQ